MTRRYEPGEDRPAPAAELDAAVSAPPEGASDGAALGGPALAGPSDGAEQISGSSEAGLWWLDGGADLVAETAELIAQIRQLAAHDPVGVQQVVADVMSALDGSGEVARPPAEGTAVGGPQGDPPPVDEAGSVAAEPA
ncbi:MAG TPA: hypothetical protein VFX61_09820 [Micromonosporaceae bacterium]|nr:hypothetical protein [Micromonosporaceae bacterium]